MKHAVFPCLGLGDGLISLVLSHALAWDGSSVNTYHPFMQQMQPLFPGLPILPRGEDIPDIALYDRIFLFYEKTSWIEKLLKKAQETAPEKLTVLNPIATPNTDYPFWEEGRFDGTKSLVENLVTFCQEILGIKDVGCSNGMTLPKEVEKGKFQKRIIIHPTSSRPGKNWSPRKFLQLSNRLAQRGFDPVFILTEEEHNSWPEIRAPSFANLVELTYFIAQSGAMIGNDSGIGHLASNVGLPTLTICRSRMSADFWRPAWSPSDVIVPPSWIPNLKRMRWRDQKWQHFVSVSQVERAFDVLLNRRELSVLAH